MKKQEQMTWKILKALCKKHKIKDSALINIAVDEKHGELVRFMPVVRFGTGYESPRDVILGTMIPIAIDYELRCERLERELADLYTRLGVEKPCK